MKSIIVFVLCTFAVITTAFTYVNSISNESCDCRPLSECHSVFEKLKLWKDPVRHYAFTKYLNLINCGYVDFEPSVCCPQEIPGEVAKLLDNKKYWTKSKEYRSLKKLKLAIWKTKNANVPSQAVDSDPSKSLDAHGQFPGCGLYSWREDSDGNRTMLGEYPWLALLEYKTPLNGREFLCGGVLISAQHILTAARCVTTRGMKLTSVILGEYDTNADRECMEDGNGNEPFCVNSVKRYDIGSLIIHEKFNDGVSHREMGDGMIGMGGLDSEDFGPEVHDIALIKLKQKVQFTDYIQPVCLPSKKPRTTRFKIAGWGRSLIPGNKGSNLKLMSYLTKCKLREYRLREIEQNYDKNEHICAGSLRRHEEQACIGDSGGPLMGHEYKDDHIDRMTVFGISYMEMTCKNRERLPGVYTNVYNYKDWIVQHLKQ